MNHCSRIEQSPARPSGRSSAGVVGLRLRAEQSMIGRRGGAAPGFPVIVASAASILSRTINGLIILLSFLFLLVADPAVAAVAPGTLKRAVWPNTS